MEWVDGSSPCNSGGSNSNISNIDMTDILREQLSLSEAKRRLLEDIVEIERQNSEELKDELHRVKKKNKCLIKCLKGISILCFILLLFYCLPSA